MAYYKCGSIYPTQNSNVVVDTASGAMANFETHLAMPLKSLKVDVNAVQDLHGQDYPFPAGGGKNLFPPKEISVSGITITLRTDGGIRINGTTASAFNATVTAPLKTGSYTLSCRFNGTTPSEGAARCQIYHQGTNLNVSIPNQDNTNSNKQFTVAEDLTGVEYRIRISANFNYQNVIYYPQLEKGSTMTNFVPYAVENICPISGVSAVSVYRCGKNLFDGVSIVYGYPLNSVIKGDNLMRIVFARCKPNTTYTISKTQSQRFSVFWCEDLPAVDVSYTNGKVDNFATSITVTTGATAKYICAFVYNQNVDTLTPDEILSSVQIEENLSATTYEAYNGSTILINLGGTYYGGYVSQDKNGKRELVVTMGFKTANEIEFKRSNNSGLWANYLFYGRIVERMQYYSILPMCNKYQVVSGAIADLQDLQFVAPKWSGSDYVYICDNNYTTPQDFVNANQDLIIVYELAEPFTIALPDGQPIKSLPGVNNIYADTGDTSLQFRKIG